MVAPVVFCDVCGEPARWHGLCTSGRERHFCGGTCIEALKETSKDDPDENLAIYSTEEAKGAMPNGTRIIKTNSEPGDGHPDGTPGVIVGSMGPAFVEKVGREAYLYFIKWRDFPVPVGTADYKIKAK